MAKQTRDGDMSSSSKIKKEKLEYKQSFAGDKAQVIDVRIIPQGIYEITSTKNQNIITEIRNKQSITDGLFLSSKRIVKILFLYLLFLAVLFGSLAMILPLFIVLWIIVVPGVFWLSFVVLIIINRIRTNTIKSNLAVAYAKAKQLSELKVKIEKNFDKIQNFIVNKRLSAPNQSEVNEFQVEIESKDADENIVWKEMTIAFKEKSVVFKTPYYKDEIRTTDIHEIVLKVGLEFVLVDCLNSQKNMSLKVSHDLIRFIYRMKKFLS